MELGHGVQDKCLISSNVIIAMEETETTHQLPTQKPPTNTGNNLSFEDQNQNRVRMEKESSRFNSKDTAVQGLEWNCDLGLKFLPSSGEDLEPLRNMRKVYLRLEDAEWPSSYKILDEDEVCIYESVHGDLEESGWSTCFKRKQDLILIQDQEQHGVLKLEFGRSRTLSCYQTLRFVAMTAHSHSTAEDPLCIIFKDRGCCIWSCFWATVTYEAVPQSDNILPFTVTSRRQWRNKAEFMVKQNDGSILAFIDRNKKSYTLTMGENLTPSMKASLIGFVIAMDIMDREDTGVFFCRLRPSTYVAILFIFILFFMIGAFLMHYITTMVLSADKCTDSIHIENDLGVPSLNLTSTRTIMPQFNATLTQEFL